MIKLVFLSAFLVLVFARPQSPSSKDATIINYVNENIGIDGYKFAYETSDGTKRDEEGQLKNAGSENEAIAVRGSFTWKDEVSGQVYTVTFVADENGYQAQVNPK